MRSDKELFTSYTIRVNKSRSMRWVALVAHFGNKNSINSFCMQTRWEIICGCEEKRCEHGNWTEVVHLLATANLVVLKKTRHFLIN
jgi:hypothetical protein